MSQNLLSCASRTLLCVVSALVVCFASGCATVRVPPKVAPQPFKMDPPPGQLGTTCATDTLGGCDRLQELQSKTTALRAVHAADMKKLKGLAKALGRLLSLPEAIPRATVVAEQPDTSGWVDPDGIYPAVLVVRLEYDRGLDRLGKKAWTDIIQAIDVLRETSELISKNWTRVAAESGSKIPPEILAERRDALVTVQLAEGTTQFRLPMDLAANYLRREAVPWVVVASHVTTEGKLKHKMIQEHIMAIRPALEITQQRKGSAMAVTITESIPLRDRKVFQSEIAARDYCKKLRGELRFVPFGQMPPRKVEFRPVAGAR
jgi:hypothetical protein